MSHTPPVSHTPANISTKLNALREEFSQQKAFAAQTQATAAMYPLAAKTSASQLAEINAQLAAMQIEIANLEEEIKTMYAKQLKLIKNNFVEKIANHVEIFLTAVAPQYGVLGKTPTELNCFAIKYLCGSLQEPTAENIERVANVLMFFNLLE